MRDTASSNEQNNNLNLSRFFNEILENPPSDHLSSDTVWVRGQLFLAQPLLLIVSGQGTPTRQLSIQCLDHDDDDRPSERSSADQEFILVTHFL